MIEWWVAQTGWVRYGFPIGLLGISTILLLCGTLWFWGFGLGFALLIGSLVFKEDPLG